MSMFRVTEGTFRGAGKRAMALLLSLLMIMSTLPMAWQAVSAADHACGLDEHSHSDECYQIVCTLAEGDQYGSHTHGEGCYTRALACECTEDMEHTEACYADKLVCSLPEGDNVVLGQHSHSDGCYKLVCDKTEHTHTEECESPVDDSDDNSEEPADDENIGSPDKVINQEGGQDGKAAKAAEDEGSTTGGYAVKFIVTGNGEIIVTYKDVVYNLKAGEHIIAHEVAADQSNTIYIKGAENTNATVTSRVGGTHSGSAFDPTKYGFTVRDPDVAEVVYTVSAYTSFFYAKQEGEGEVSLTFTSATTTLTDEYQLISQRAPETTKRTVTLTPNAVTNIVSVTLNGNPVSLSGTAGTGKSRSFNIQMNQNDMNLVVTTESVINPIKVNVVGNTEIKAVYNDEEILLAPGEYVLDPAVAENINKYVEFHALDNSLIESVSIVGAKSYSGSISNDEHYRRHGVTMADTEVVITVKVYTSSIKAELEGNGKVILTYGGNDFDLTDDAQIITQRHEPDTTVSIKLTPQGTTVINRVTVNGNPVSVSGSGSFSYKAPKGEALIVVEAESVVSPLKLNVVGNSEVKVVYEGEETILAPGEYVLDDAVPEFRTAYVEFNALDNSRIDLVSIVGAKSYSGSIYNDEHYREQGITMGDVEAVITVEAYTSPIKAELEGNGKVTLSYDGNDFDLTDEQQVITQRHEPGTTVSITLTPQGTTVINRVTVNGNPVTVDGNGKFSYTAPKGDAIIVVESECDKSPLKVKVVGNSDIKVAYNGEEFVFAPGDHVLDDAVPEFRTVYVEFNALDNSRIDLVSIVGAKSYSGSIYNNERYRKQGITMGESEVVITVEAYTSPIKAELEGNGKVTLSYDGNDFDLTEEQQVITQRHEPGTTVSITLTPQGTTVINRVTVNGNPVSVSGNGKFSYTAPKGDAIIVVEAESNANPIKLKVVGNSEVKIVYKGVETLFAPGEYVLDAAVPEFRTVYVEFYALEASRMALNIEGAKSISGSILNTDNYRKHGITMGDSEVVITVEAYTSPIKAKMIGTGTVTLTYAGTDFPLTDTEQSVVERLLPGTKVNISLTPQENTAILGVTVNGNPVKLSNSNTFSYTAPDGEALIVVEAALITHELSAMQSGEGTVSITYGGNKTTLTSTEQVLDDAVVLGSDVEFALTVAGNTRVLDVTVNGKSIGNDKNFEMPDKDAVIVVKTELIKHELSAKQDGEGTVSITYNGNDTELSSTKQVLDSAVVLGSDVEFTLTPAANTRIVSVTVGGEDLGDARTFKMPNADTTIVVETEFITYTITWVDEDGTVLEEDKNVTYGTMPSYDGETPIKEADDQYTYSFDKWTPDVVEVTGDATYTATYTETLNKYTVTWVDEDGTVLEEDKNVAYGTMPTYDGETPTKAATAQYTYTFDKWTPDVVEVTGDATYTATYTETLNKYTVTWVDEDGTVLEKDENVTYGTMPTYDGETPTKEADEQYAYTFDKWTPDVVEVTGDATYTATYVEVPATCTVTFKDSTDDSTIGEVVVEYGTAATAPASPTHEGLEFSIWATEKNGETAADFSAVIEDMTVWAVYKSAEETPREPITGAPSVVFEKESKTYEIKEDIKFKAIGFWADNTVTEFVDGDERYVPLKWHHDEPSGDFGGKTAPDDTYTGVFERTKAGTYTLKTEFTKYVYENGAWVDKGIVTIETQYKVVAPSGGSTDVPDTGDHSSDDAVVLAADLFFLSGLTIFYCLKRRRRLIEK